jgi:hypothetical protein
MLIKKGYTEGDIVTFKLVNGDEIVAKIKEETDTSFSLDRPCTVIPSPQGIGLMQTLFTANPDASISISKQHIIMHSPVIDKMESHYIQTTTGIQPITKGGIVV